MSLLAGTLLAFVPAATADQSGEPAPTSSEQIAQLQLKRAETSPENLDLLADIDLDIFYAVQTSGDVSAERELARGLEAYVQAEIDEVLKSYIFHSVFMSYSATGDFDDAVDLMMEYVADASRAPWTIRLYTTDQALVSVYEELQMPGHVVETMTGLLNDPKYASLTALATDVEYNHITLARAHRNLGDLDLAMEAIQKAQFGLENPSPLARQRDAYVVELTTIDILLERANIELAMERYASAESTAWQLYSAVQKIGLSRSMIDALDLLGRIELAKEEFDSSYQYFMRARESTVFTEESAPEAFYKNISAAAEGRGDLNAALNFFKTHLRLLSQTNAKRNASRLRTLILPDPAPTAHYHRHSVRSASGGDRAVQTLVWSPM